jgi:hypothetical protein
MDITRRNFLKGLIISGLSPIIVGCSEPQIVQEMPVNLLKWNYYNSKIPQSLTEIQTESDYEIKARPDPKERDIWESAKRVMIEGGADCDGRAIYVCSRLEKLGYPPKILILRGKRKISKEECAHWVAKIEHMHENGKIEYGASDNYNPFFKEEFPTNNPKDRIFKGYSSIDELINEINRKSEIADYYKHKTINAGDLGEDWRDADRDLWNPEIASDLGFTRVKVSN